MNLFNMLNRQPPLESPWGKSGIARNVEATVAHDPSSKLGDPLYGLKLYTVETQYRQYLNQGTLTVPTWCLHEAMRLSSILGNYIRLWMSTLSGLEYQIKVRADSGDAGIKQQQALENAYENIDVEDVIGKLALADVYGVTVLQRNKNGTLSYIRPWNLVRDGLYGALKWNPDAKQMKYSSFPDADILTEKDCIIRTVEQDALLELLRIHLLYSSCEVYLDRNLQQEAQRQVVVLTGSPPTARANEYYEAAQLISEGRSGYLAKGSKDAQTEVIFPPASRGLPYFDKRLQILDDMAAKVLFGSSLTTNTTSGSGTLAGSAHTETTKKRIGAAVQSISAALQSGFDIPVLRNAGLLPDGSTPLAYFALGEERAADPSAEIDWTAKLKSAGYERDIEELNERTGMKLIKSGTEQVIDVPAE